MFRRLRGRIARTLDRRFDQLAGRIDEVQASIDEIAATLRAIASEEPANRRRLYELRASPGYEQPFTETDPLVSVCVAARADRTRLLVERALPSALAQTHENIEIVVVGDAAGSGVREAVEGVSDGRIRFSDLTHRVVHPDPHRHWLTGTIMPRNEAHRQARGLWIADLDDDDVLRPDAIERLVAFAQSERVEVAYGIVEQHEPDGGRTRIGGFPPGPLEPDASQRSPDWQPWQGSASTGAIFHAGLRLFAREHVAAELGLPGDFFRLERMVRAGVRFGMLERVTYDYYPSKLWER
jgi:glycosyltransferase involved in cell wall biosynthesis